MVFGQWNWTVQSPLPTGSNLKSAVWTGSRLVTAGSEGTILSTQDGVSWMDLGLKGNQYLKHITWTGKQLIAAGDSGKFYLSADGTDWTVIYSGINKTINDIVWTGERYVAVGNQGLILTSADGLQWTGIDPGIPNWLNSVIWINGQFMAVGSGGIVLTSNDGEAWQSTVIDSTYQLNSILWTGSRFLIAGSQYSSASGHQYLILSSSNGRIWEKSWSPKNAEADSYCLMNCVVTTGDQFVAVGTGGMVVTSPDGSVWTTRVTNTRAELMSVVWTGAQFYVVGNATILTSPDGMTWINRGAGAVGPLTSITWTGNQLVAIVADAIYKSYDGITWTDSSAGRFMGLPAYLLSVTSSQGELIYTGYVNNGYQAKFVATAYGFRQQATTDEWVGVLYSAAYNGSNTFIAVGYEGSYGAKNGIISGDGKSWGEIDLRGNSIIWADSAFIMVGREGYICKQTPDGWKQIKSPSTSSLQCIVDAGDQFVAVGDNGTIVTIRDTVANIQNSGTSVRLESVVWSGKQLAAVGRSGTILTSLDGEVWTSRNSGTVYNLHSITCTGKQFVAVGDNGTILTSINEMPVSVGQKNVTSTLKNDAMDLKLSARQINGVIVAQLSGFPMNKNIVVTLFNLSGNLLRKVTVHGTQYILIKNITKTHGVYLLRAETDNLSAACPVAAVSAK